MDILKHRLVDCGAEHLVCPKNTRKLIGPDMIVLHYTAGTGGMSSALNLIRPEVKASAHLVIGRKGELIQLVAFDAEAWHAGKSRYAGRINLNRYSIGIELDNLERLRQEKDRFVAECGKEVEPEEVYTDTSEPEVTYWHRYSDRQKKRLREVCRLLEDYYPIRYIVGHSDITDRKQDPGPELEEFMHK